MMIKPNKNKYLQIRKSDIVTVLAADVCIKGHLSFKTSLMIEGEFEGEIDSQGLLLVGQTGVVKAKIRVNTLISYGKICGDIIARKHVVLCAGSKQQGNIESPDLTIESGSIFNGLSKMPIPLSTSNTT